ncbi:hypothetical protein V1523DRAFT_442775 [Lipomyces doorenjongii]
MRGRLRVSRWRLKSCSGNALLTQSNHRSLLEALIRSKRHRVIEVTVNQISGTYVPDFTIQKKVENVDALLAETGSHFVLGVSSGGLVALRAVLNIKTIHKAVIFEPPLVINDSLSTEWVERFDKEMAIAKIASELLTGILGAQMGLPSYNLILRKTIEGSSDGSDGPLPMKVPPTMHYDFQLAFEMKDKPDIFKTIEVDVLLLGGSKSAPYLKMAVDALEKVIPNATRMEFEGLNPGATRNKNRAGHCQRVAAELLSFIT